MNAKSVRYTLALAVGLTTLTAAAIGIARLLAMIPVVKDDWALFVAVSLLLVFLVLLVARYLSLMWLGYLHHLEARVADPTPEGTWLPPVTILVPCYNEGAVIARAIESLLELDYPMFEVLVIDDGSTDDTREAVAPLEGRHGDVTVRLVSKGNGGKASALNTGIALARHDYILAMDGDSRLTRDTLRAAMRHFGDPRVGAVAGNVKVTNRRNLWTKLQALEYIEGLNMARRAQGFLRAVNIIPGPIGIFRRDVLLAVGGYDTDTYAEDADLTLKLLTAGWHIAYEDRAIAWTEAPEQLLDLLKQRYRWTRGILQALRKRASFLVLPRHGFGVWLSVNLMFFEGIVWPAVNILGNGLFAVLAIRSGAGEMVLFWWLLLTMLDVVAAVYTVAMEEEELSLVLYAVVYRFVFINIIDVAKLMATVEEFLGVRMSWGKLERAGRL
ncbi:MAG TPA: glycosyltransferase family 2 protein [Gemmatimonadales bacterium]|nr:glycosyltransferase family 2 protein [Gemmatimonadales bacterium]